MITLWLRLLPQRATLADRKCNNVLSRKTLQISFSWELLEETEGLNLSVDKINRYAHLFVTDPEKRQTLFNQNVCVYPL
jgi:hypothetical protein